MNRYDNPMTEQAVKANLRRAVSFGCRLCPIIHAQIDGAIRPMASGV